MIFFVSQKYFKKHADELVAPRQYFIIDGENFGVTSSQSESIANRYSNSHTLGGWCPERELFVLLKKKKNKEDYNKKKLERMTDEFLKSADFIGAVCASVKAQATYGVKEDINIFVVVPGVVYKMLGKKIKERVYKLIKAEGNPEFFFLQDELKKDDLKDGLKKKQLKAILEGVKKAEKKHKLDYTED